MKQWATLIGNLGLTATRHIGYAAFHLRMAYHEGYGIAAVEAMEDEQQETRHEDNQAN